MGRLKTIKHVNVSARRLNDRITKNNKIIRIFKNKTKLENGIYTIKIT